jgi:D-alanyl-D-alanine carboxypeptidase
MAFMPSSFADNHSIKAKSWLVTDSTGSVQTGSNYEEQRSIASITKLMTVMAVLDHGQNLAEKLGKYTREQLIKLSLIKSDNWATDVLCNSMPGGRSACVKYMNEKAGKLGMQNTKFIEPTGLSPMNISTATDLIKLVKEASHYPQIVEASGTAKYPLVENKKTTTVYNTNKLVGSGRELLVSKTGTTNAAGQCVVMMDADGRVYILLGMQPGRRLLESKEIVTM